MSILFSGESARSRAETEQALREARFTPEDFEPRISDWFGIPYGLEDFRPMLGNSLIIIILIWIFVKNKYLFMNILKEALELKEPIQRVGFVLVCIGLTIFSMCLIYDIINSYPRSLSHFFYSLFDEWKRRYYFRYVLAWYGLIILSIGVFLVWVHEHTTALLWNWIKHGK